MPDGQLEQQSCFLRSAAKLLLHNEARYAQTYCLHVRAQRQLRLLPLIVLSRSHVRRNPLITAWLIQQQPLQPWRAQFWQQ
jgi:hypothetical protein